MFLRYIHNFRAIAILFIVIGHYIPPVNLNIFRLSQSQNLLTATSQFSSTIFTNGTVYFVFIAAFLFQYLSQKFKYNKFLTAKLKYVILPYVLYSLPAIFLIWMRVIVPPIWLPQSFLNLPHVNQIALYLITGSALYHLWFIPMFTIFYLISPILLKIDRNLKLYCLLPALMIIPLIVPRQPHNENLFLAFIHFSPIYLLGMFSSRYKDQLIDFLNRYWWPILIFCTVLIMLESTLNPSPKFLNVIQKSLLCWVIMYLLWKLDAKIPQWLHQMFDLLANYSFGIYFIHAYLLNLTISLTSHFITSKPEVIQFLSHPNLFEQFIIQLLIILSIAANIALCLLFLSTAKRILGKYSRLLVCY